MADEVTESQQAIFDQGHAVGLLAQRHFPDGILIDVPYDDLQLAVEQTHDAIARGALNIYEATLSHDGVLVRVDILTRKTQGHPWDIVEVKSSTQVKDVHLSDAAVQMWVCEGAGLKMSSASIMTINNQCVFPDLSGLFNLTDVTKQIDEHLGQMPTVIATFKKMLASKTVPKDDIGPHCDDPYGCSFKSHCWTSKKIPEISVFDIPRLADSKKWKLYAEGTFELEKLDSGDFNKIQARMIECTVSKKRFLDSTAISKELRQWTFPFSFLDFETIGYAVPRYEGQRPYQQLPFQFSCHVRRSKESELEHCEYLHMTDTDPRESICKALVDSVPASGSVIAYNMGFESMVLKALAEAFPKYRSKLLNIANRLVDPLPVFRSHVYDPKFRGSFSIKTVAPAILGGAASYGGMAVGDGSEAQAVYLRMIDTSSNPSEKDVLRKNLIEYCTKDTMAMVGLVDWLFRVSEGSHGEDKCVPL